MTRRILRRILLVCPSAVIVNAEAGVVVVHSGHDHGGLIDIVVIAQGFFGIFAIASEG
jgi:predicted MPP superfamily phosphohydrolase